MSWRWLVVGLALAGCSAPPPAAAPEPVAPAPERVLLVGDSIMEEVAAGVSAATDADVSYVLTIGTANVEDDWWEVWPRVVERDRPDVVAVLVGPWEIDRPDLGSPAWATWYGDRLDRWADQLTAGGARLVWVQPPVVRDPAAEPRFAHVRQAYAELAARRDDVTVVDPLPGPFRTSVRGDRLRRIDGLHLCPAGAAVVARAVLDAAGLPEPPAGWEDAAWTREPPAASAEECPAT